MVYKYIVLFFLIISIIGNAQKKYNPTPEDVSLAKELAAKYPDDDIAILKDSIIINFDFNKKTKLVTANYNSIKTYINLKSRTEIPLFIFYDDQSRITDTALKYRNNKNSDLFFKDEFYSSDDLFYNDARVKWTVVNFPLLGYKYSFTYNKSFKDIKYFVNTYFDNEYPTLKKSITVHIPDWLDLEIKELNFAGHSIAKDKVTNPKKRGTSYIYTLENGNAVAKEEFSPGPTHFRPHLLFLAKSHTKNKTKEKLLNETKDLYNWYHSLILQMEEDTSLLEEKTNALTENCTTDEEKIKKIYYWVQDNIRYIAFEDGVAGFKPDESQNVYKKKYGDCKGMANLTKQMLKIAGFDARLTWIGTKRIAYDYSLPTIAADNHMICTVLSENKKYFLDATEKYNPLGKYAERIQNKQVLIENDDDFILDRIPSTTSLDNQETLISTLSIDEEKLKGNIKRTYKGESKTNFLYNINNLKKDEKGKVLEYYIKSDDKNILLRDIEVSDISDRDGDLELSYTIEQNNAVSRFENELYIDIDYYKNYQDLNLKERKTSFLLPYKIFKKTSTTLKIPEGYTIKELPNNLAVQHKDFEISFNYSSKGDSIIYEKTIDFANAQIEESSFKEWQVFYKKLKDQYQQQIILIKK